ncbi:acyl-CoA dehydrogenase family protein [Streptomyces sp. NPDC046831]|uniref:acyl-CoA dehydrogenase family protein n=1 Tax=Streptomyces sp. NPDC046831 TaxID=3154805 RepID=UPI0033DB1970
MSDTATDAAAPEAFWKRVAHELADDLAVDALDRDRAGKPPYDEVARLREAGLPAALAPPGAAGEGMGWADACAVVRRIAAADGSMGELLGRHYVLAHSARFFAAPERAAGLEARARREQWLWAGDTGAPGAGAPGGDSASPVLLPAGDGHLLRGHRTLATAVNAADRLVVDAVCTVTGESLVVLVDPRHPGVGRDLLHDRFGQRLAGAGTVLFDDVPVGADQVLGPAAHDEDAVAPFTTLAPLALRLMLAQVALGIAEGALAEARDLTRAASHRRRADGGVSPSGPVGVDADGLLAFGRLALATHTASAVAGRATAAMDRALRTGRELDAGQCAETAALVAAAEAVTVRAALRTGERVLDLAGAEGLDRFWRNIRTLAGRGPSDPALRAIGDHFLNSGGEPSASWI